jgi:CHAT domain-containing protein
VLGIRLTSIAFVCAASVTQAAESPFAWISPTEWPATINVSEVHSSPRLVVIEENGANLVQRKADGSTANSPGRRRMGPEFHYIEAGQPVRLEVASYFNNVPPGKFRYRVLTLEATAEISAAKLLGLAGEILAGSDEVAHKEACPLYQQVALASDIPLEWKQVATFFYINCKLSVGEAIQDENFGGIEKIENAFSLLPHHVAWLRATEASTRDSLPLVIESYQRALGLLEKEQQAYPDFAFALMLDEADMNVELAGANIVYAWRSGNGTESLRMLDAAELLLTTSLEAAQRYGEHIIQAGAYDFFAALSMARENHDGHISYMLKAKAEVENSGHPEEQIAMLGSIGDYYREWGNLPQALQSYLEAMRLREKYNLKNRAADSYHNLGRLYHLLGDLPRARAMTEKSAAMRAEQGNQRRYVNLKLELATILEDEKDYAGAHELLTEMVDYYLAQQDQWDPFRIRGQVALSRIESKQGNIDLAYRHSSELYNHLQGRVMLGGLEIVPAYINHGSLLAQQGKVAEALALLDETLVNKATQTIDKIAVLAAILDIQQQRRNTEQAIAVSNRLFDLIESQQIGIESARLGPYWGNKMHQIYMGHVEYLLELEQVPDQYRNRAFAIVERAQATSLRLRRQEMLLSSNASNTEARSEWLSLMQQAEAAANPNADEQELLALERQIGEARERFFFKYGANIPRQSPVLVEAGHLSAKLPKGTRVLEYVAGSKNIWRFDIDGAGWTVTQIGSTQTISSAVDAVLFDMQQPNKLRVQNLKLLSDLLLAGLELTKDYQQLLIVPPTGMNSIPFAALYSNNRFLGAQARLALVPSLSEYFTGGSKEPHVGELQLAVLADPDFARIDGHLPGDGNDELFRSWSDTLDRLPATAQEAQGLGSFYAEDRRLILTGEAANQANLFSDKVRNARIIHLATHGYFNEHLPELVGLALSDTDESDGFVSLAEISTQQFTSDLVVISACSTAQGESLAGEGNMSLARAFLAQGVDAVIATLWPVSDKATALFMKEFYKALNEEGKDYASALQSAQQHLRDSPTYRNPYYWAAYVLTTVSNPLSAAR